MSKNTISDLKDHLFDVIERLKEGNDPKADKKDTIELDRAEAIVNVAKVIVDAAKTEVQAMGILAKSENPNRTQDALVNSGLLAEGRRKSTGTENQDSLTKRMPDLTKNR